MSRTVSIPDRLAEEIDKAVAAGEYASAEDVISEVLGLWLRRHEQHAEEHAWLKARINAALDDPRPTLSMEEVKAHLKSVMANAAARRDAAA